MDRLDQWLSDLPSELIVFLQTEFQKLHKQYFLGRWEPAQLDGGRFAEAILRILQYKDIGTFTPIGTQLNRSQIVISIRKNKNLPESFRFHVLGLTELILDFRNKRNVGHLGAIDVNEMDSTVVLQMVNWIVAELIRVDGQMSPTDAEAEIKKIIERKVPIIEEIGGRLKCLNPKLDAKQKSLIFCYQKYPEAISLNDLYDWSEYTNKGVLRAKLVELNKDGRLSFRNDSAVLTKMGLLWIEKNISFELEI